jgi:hypothetical protein
MSPPSITLIRETRRSAANQKNNEDPDAAEASLSILAYIENACNTRRCDAIFEYFLTLLFV